MPRAISTATISFGMVAIPVKIYTAADSKSISFNLLHKDCDTKINQVRRCKACDVDLKNDEMVKGYEYSKGQYVKFTSDEMVSFDVDSDKVINLEEFVPADKVDPIYFEKSYYVGPDKGGSKAYKLLSEALKESGKVGIAQHTMRGRKGVVVIRPYKDGLMLHNMFYDEEIRSWKELDLGDAQVNEDELNLALKIINGGAKKVFASAKYKDEYRSRIEAAVEKKISGQEVVGVDDPPVANNALDLMAALKASLEKNDG